MRSGPQLQKEYNSTVFPKGVEILAYPFLKATIGGLTGFIYLLPDIEDEACRRNSVFRERRDRYDKWLNNETRTQESFIIKSIDSILSQDDKRKKYLDMEFLNRRKREITEEYKCNFFPVHYATENLIDWLEDKLFKQVSIDYQMGTATDKNLMAGILHKAVKDLKKVERGALYLAEKCDSADSVINRTLNLVAMKSTYDDSAAIPNIFAWARKWDNVVFDFLEEIIPVIIAKNKTAGMRFVANLALACTGQVLDFIKVKPANWSSIVVDVADVEGFLKKTANLADHKYGKYLLSFIETANVVFAIVGVCSSKSPAELTKNIINLLGALADLSVNCWLTKKIVEKYKATGPLMIASGIIDCVIGIWQMYDEVKTGDIDASLGWMTFAIGGGIIVAGCIIRMTATKAVVASGGTAVKPGAIVIAVGLVLEGIGLIIVACCNNNEIEDWMETCSFGDSFGGKPYKQQIADLNNILCKFEVDAEFNDVEEKFNNRTYVKFIIKPRAIADNSRFVFSNLQGYAYARTSEYVLGNRHDIVSGQSGSENPVLDLANPHNCTIIRDGNRIKKIETTLSYGMDIDEVKGTIALDMGNSSLQGYVNNFVVKA